MDRIHVYLPGWDIPKVSRELLTDHFGLVSDFLSECWNQLRVQPRASQVQGRVHYGGALSGRDVTAVQKTVSGLLKLLYPSPDAAIPDEALEWTVRLALECRRRVKEQQKRIGSVEFRNAHFSYQMGDDDVEKFVATPEHRDRSASSRTGVGDLGWWRRRKSRSLSNRCDARSRLGREDPQSAHAATISRKRTLRGAESLHTGQKFGWRPRSTRARVFGAAPRVRCSKERLGIGRFSASFLLFRVAGKKFERRNGRRRWIEPRRLHRARLQRFDVSRNRR